MHQFSWTSSVLAALLVFRSSAKPFASGDHSKVHRVPVPIISEKDKSQTNGTETPSSASNTPPNGNPGRGSARVNTWLSNQGSEYLCPVTIGGQTMKMHLDTGSSDLWLFSAELSPEERGSHAFYDPTKSSTYKPKKNAMFNVSYGDNNTLIGTVATDTVTIGGIKVDSQALELTTSYRGNMGSDPADGIVGLGFQSLNSIYESSTHRAVPQRTWFENLLLKKSLSLGVFTVNFKAGTPGYYNFGAIDYTAAARPIKYTEVNSSRGYWQLNSPTYQVGNQPGASAKTFVSYVDTGATLMLLDDKTVQAYYEAVPSPYYEAVLSDSQPKSGDYDVPCSAKLPDLTLAWGAESNLTIKGEFLNKITYPNDKNRCLGGIQSNGVKDFQLFGGPLFKSHLVVFDYDNMRIGFAPHA